MKKSIFLVLFLLSTLAFGDAVQQSEPQLPTDITYFSIDNDTQAILLDFFNSAQKSIYIADYSFNLPPLVDLLISKFKGGVDVQLIIDKTQAAGPSAKPLIKKLQDAGVPVVVGNSRRNQIMHLKMGIIDNISVISGSYNFTGTAAKEENFFDIWTNDPIRAAKYMKVWSEIHDHIVDKVK